jgi:hypothetical protein
MTELAVVLLGLSTIAEAIGSFYTTRSIRNLYERVRRLEKKQ